MKRILLLTFGLLLTACGTGDNSGPANVTWDRDACERCRMVLSDRHYAAQIVRQSGRGGEHQQVFKFDDLGCAVIWLEQQSWKDAPDTHIWVNDYHSGAWLNARTAFYLPAQNTPMDYGLGATTQPSDNTLDFAAAKTAILGKDAQSQHHHHHN